jgi:ligand-binding SRPBCC domain-containing protein
MLIRFNKVEPLGEASIADFVMWLGPLPIHWVAQHSDVGPSGFTDTQKVGPFKFWKHSHQFVALDEKTTVVVDEIHAELGDRPFWGCVSRIMWINLPILFAYRGWITRRSLEGKLR